MTKRSQYLHIHYTDISPPEPVAPVRGVAGLQGGQPTPGHIPASEQEQQVSPTKANPEAAREAVEHHVPPPREGQVGSHSVPVVQPGQDRDGETIWKWQVTNLSSCHLDPPPSRPQPSAAAIPQVYDVPRAGCRPTIIRNGLLFLFSIYREA